ncbi:MAG TPA: OmpA family protein [Flavobacterium sp.]|uniref:OmpA family protein n=1 Tax=Flavobacterium sp. TaxID=239 RepID=UPI002CBB15A5|nr:OmpA family protein [Flavobacterium sp.]MCA0348973.1 OmpA family protein [Bacteroidota bacterium]HPW98187.1 OmpA family protein [Flavobacterium sp.]HQA74803.1 OmpA family protein [Flavobacterium sp.]
MKYRILFALLFISFWGYSQLQFTVFFETNKYQLNDREDYKLQSWISENRNNKVVAIHGFTDEDGTTSSNDTLAQKRVKAIFEIINGKMPIREDFKTISFGENFNQSKNKADNRKVTIYYILEKDLARENEILGIKEAPKLIEVAPKAEINYPDKMVFENPNGTTSEFKLDVEFMKKVGNATVGEKLKIDNLEFMINTFAVVNESRGKLYELLLVLQHNPQLKIEIQGHLCCMPVDRTDLSTKRAKAIYSFLVANQIYPPRLSYKGFGSSQPIFPIPEKNEAERAANRRVEIVIVAN